MLLWRQLRGSYFGLEDQLSSLEECSVCSAIVLNQQFLEYGIIDDDASPLRLVYQRSILFKHLYQGVLVKGAVGTGIKESRFHV